MLLLSKIEFKSLKTLQLFSNKVTSLENLKTCSFGRDLLDLKLDYIKIGSLSEFSNLYFPNLVNLTLNDNNLHNFEYIKNIQKAFPKLKYLEIKFNSVSSLDGFENLNLKNLETLIITHSTDLVDLSKLREASLPSLIYLEVGYNSKVANLDWMNSLIMENLEILKVSNSAIENIEGLKYAYLPELNEIYLQNNKIQEVSTFKDINLPNLKYLTLYKNELVSAEGINSISFPNLETLILSDNHLTDLNGVFLNENSNHFDELKGLYAVRNEFTDLDWLNYTVFPKLENINLFRNKIENFKGIKNCLCPLLNNLDLSENSLTNLDDFNGVKLNKLKKINLMSNQIDKIGGILQAELKGLEELNSRDNKIDKTSSENMEVFEELRDKGVNLSV